MQQARGVGGGGEGSGTASEAEAGDLSYGARGRHEGGGWVGLW